MDMIIKPCTCLHADQDRRYEKQQRLWTVGKKDVTCTVCGTVKGKSS